jgi:long-chain alkane monooxygenase
LKDFALATPKGAGFTAEAVGVYGRGMREIRLNAFEMNCVGHQSPGLWAYPRDRSVNYTDLDYWTGLARTLERGKFDGIFLADVLGIYDVYGGSPDAALRHAVQVPVNDRCY